MHRRLRHTLLNWRWCVMLPVMLLLMAPIALLQVANYCLWHAAEWLYDLVEERAGPPFSRIVGWVNDGALKEPPSETIDDVIEKHRAMIDQHPCPHPVETCGCAVCAWARDH